jgi:hypothetical protein
MSGYIWAVGDKLATWATNSRVPSWACLAVAWLVALFAMPYIADEIGSRLLFYVVGVVVLVGYWPSVVYLIRKAREGAEEAARRRILEQFMLLETVRPGFEAELESTLTEADFARLLRELTEHAEAEEARLERHRRSRGVKKRRRAK